MINFSGEDNGVVFVIKLNKNMKEHTYLQTESINPPVAVTATSGNMYVDYADQNK